MEEREDGTYCPLLRKDCIKFKCKFWTKLVGRHPQIEGQTIDHYDCTWKWMPILMIENTKEAIGVTHSIDAFRNAMAKGQDNVLRLVEAGEAVGPGGEEMKDASSDNRTIEQG